MIWIAVSIFIIAVVLLSCYVVKDVCKLLDKMDNLQKDED